MIVSTNSVIASSTGMNLIVSAMASSRQTPLGFRASAFSAGAEFVWLNASHVSTAMRISSCLSPSRLLQSFVPSVVRYQSKAAFFSASVQPPPSPPRRPCHVLGSSAPAGSSSPSWITCG